MYSVVQFGGTWRGRVAGGDRFCGLLIVDGISEVAGAVAVRLFT